MDIDFPIRPTIIVYHRVLEKSDPFQLYDPTIEEFEKQILLYSRRYKCFTVSDAIARMESNTLPWNSLCVTFDDGYSDYYQNALPILTKYNVPSTMYVSTESIGMKGMWNDYIKVAIINSAVKELDLSSEGVGKYVFNSFKDRIDAFKDIQLLLKYTSLSIRKEIVEEMKSHIDDFDLLPGMLGENEIKELHKQGVEIGSHTINHPILGCLNKNEARIEIEGSKMILEEMIGSQINSFAFPNGKPDVDYKNEHVELIAQSGYSSAVTTSPGLSGTFDMYQAPRFSPARHTGLGLFLRIIKNYFVKTTVV